MAENKYKIIVDANFICRNQEDELAEILNFKIFEVKEFIEKYNPKGTEICVPEIVFYETIQRRLDIIDKIIYKIDYNFKKIKDLGIAHGTQTYEKKDYEGELNKKLKKIIKENKFTIIKTPTIKYETLLERVLHKIPPFSDEDRGFKDTLIWFSILECAKRNKETNFILLTQNVKHFKDEKLEKEFKKYSSKKIKIISEIPELKEFFDLELRLKLKLKETHKNIENGIKEDIGRVLMELHNKRYFYMEYPGKRPFERFLMPVFSVTNVKEINKSLYSVSLILQTRGVVGERKEEDTFMVTGTSSWVTPVVPTGSPFGSPFSTIRSSFLSEEYKEATFEINLTYSLEKGKIDQVSYINPSYPVIEGTSSFSAW